MRLAALAALSLALAGCSTTAPAGNVNVALVTANGDNPLVGRTIDRVRVSFRQGSEAFDAVEGTVNGQSFDVVVPIADYLTAMELRYELYEGSTLVLLGATPFLYPGSGAATRAVVAPPTSCVLVSIPTVGTTAPSVFPRPQADFGTLFLSDYAFLLGGRDATGPTNRVDYLDAISLAPAEYGAAALPMAPGKTRAVPISLRQGLVVSESDAPFLFDAYGPYHGAISLHAGAGLASELVVLGSSVGAAVVGGSSQGQPVSDVSFVATDGTVTTGHLSTAVAERAAALAGGAVLVVSRGTGDAVLERIAPGETASTVLLPAIADGTRNGGILLASTDGSTLLLLGGTDGVGAPRTDSVLFTGCPTSCVAGPGPTWATARTGAAVDPSGLLVGGAGPSALVEQVVFASGGASLVARGTLAAPRANPGLVVLPSGVAYVLAGEGTSGPRADWENCVPTGFVD
ncbi:MAG: hypothetical protein U0230_27835 [Polyangiales bacterium]